jgi:hypothetical protein
MTEASKPSRKRLWIILVIILVFLILLIGAWLLQTNRLERARLENMPPFVFLSHPQQGDRFRAGQMVFVDASARGSSPVVLLELLLDGQVIEEDVGPNPGGSIVRYGYFSFPVSEGVHIIHVRATDSAGHVGLSIPLGIEALAAHDDEEQMALLRFGPEMDLEGIAEMAGIPPDELLDWNPGLGEWEQPRCRMMIRRSRILSTLRRPRVRSRMAALRLRSSGICSPPMFPTFPGPLSFQPACRQHRSTSPHLCRTAR